TGDQEYVDLLETSRASGIFVKAIELTTGAPGADGKLSVSPSDQIEAVHQDYQGLTSSSAIADIVGGSVVFFDEAGEPTEELLEADEARVRLFSVLNNTSPSTVDTAYITVQARSGDQESMTLTETGADTSVFEGSIPMAVAPWSSGNMVLETSNSGFPEFLPDEVTARYSPSVQATAR